MKALNYSKGFYLDITPSSSPGRVSAQWIFSEGKIFNKYKPVRGKAKFCMYTLNLHSHSSTLLLKYPSFGGVCPTRKKQNVIFSSKCPNFYLDIVYLQASRYNGCKAKRLLVCVICLDHHQ